MKIACIYAITNLVNWNRYIGSTIDFEGRKAGHLRDLTKGRHKNRHLQCAWNKYGPDAFKFWIMSVITNTDQLLDSEQAWIDGFNPQYNICPRANSVLGVKRSQETRDKIGKSKLGFRHSAETKLKMSLSHTPGSNLGKKFSKETCEKIRLAGLGRRASPEERKKRSIAWTGERNPNFGIPLSEERKAKLREGRKHAVLSDEGRARISAANLGKTVSDATRAKLSATLTGRVLQRTGNAI